MTIKLSLTISFILLVTYSDKDGLKGVLGIVLYLNGRGLTIDQLKDLFWYLLIIIIGIGIFAAVYPDKITRSNDQKDS